MAYTAIYSGTTASAVGTTEFSLTNNSTTAPAAKTDNGAIFCKLDCNAVVAGDLFELVLYEKPKSGGTQRLVDKWLIGGGQGRPCFITPTLPLANGWDFTLKKISGTDRSFDFEIGKF